jgi:phosphatidylserine/phosphatidylglycerophosphate/cardiolipin synthase-like enzyme
MPQLIFKTENLKKWFLIGFLIIGILRQLMFAQATQPKSLELATKHGETEEVEVYFSPGGDCQQEIIDELDRAKVQLDVTMYTFTATIFTETLINAKTKGVVVRVYLDDSMKGGKYSQAKSLQEAGIPVKFDNHAGLMHNKFVVIDNKTVVTGSYNWTKRSEEQNDENVVIIRDEEIAKLYADKFEKYWQTQQ